MDGSVLAIRTGLWVSVFTLNWNWRYWRLAMSDIMEQHNQWRAIGEWTSEHGSTFRLSHDDAKNFRFHTALSHERGRTSFVLDATEALELARQIIAKADAAHAKTYAVTMDALSVDRLLDGTYSPSWLPLCVTAVAKGNTVMVETNNSPALEDGLDLDSNVTAYSTVVRYDRPVIPRSGCACARRRSP